EKEPNFASRLSNPKRHRSPAGATARAGYHEEPGWRPRSGTTSWFGLWLFDLVPPGEVDREISQKPCRLPIAVQAEFVGRSLIAHRHLAPGKAFDRERPPVILLHEAEGAP